jgi:hypothetical protein
MREGHPSFAPSSTRTATAHTDSMGGSAALGLKLCSRNYAQQLEGKNK